MPGFSPNLTFGGSIPKLEVGKFGNQAQSGRWVVRISLVLFGIAVVLALASLSACSDRERAPAGKNLVLTWWHINSDKPAIAAIDSIARDFEKANPHITIQTLPLDNLEFRSKLQLMLNANDPPDIFASWGGGGLQEQVAAGKIKDITDWVKGADWTTKINPAALGIYSFDKRIYGFPQDLGMVGFWYNRTLLAKAGFDKFPADWANFLRLLQALQAKGITPIALGLADKWPVSYYWGYLTLRIGGPDIYADILARKKKFTDPACIEAARMMQALMALAPFQASYTADDFAGQSRLMGDGESAMQLMGQWALGVQAQFAEKKGALAAEMSFAAFPAVAGGLGSIKSVMGGANGFVVARDAPAEAVQLLEFFNRPENQQRYFDAFPAIPTSPLAKISEPALLLVKRELETMEHFCLYPDQTFTNEVNSLLNDISARIMIGELSPEQGCELLQASWEKSAQ